MKQLVLMRHAKAEKNAPSGEDFDRPLSPVGRREATTVAKALEAHSIRPDFAIVSAALRTRQTFEQVEAVFGPIPSIIDKAFYNADAGTLRRLVEAHEDHGLCVLVINHNPGIQSLSVDYMIESAASLSAIDRVRNGFETATAAFFDVDVAGRPVYEGLYSPDR